MIRPEFTIHYPSRFSLREAPGATASIASSARNEGGCADPPEGAVSYLPHSQRIPRVDACGSLDEPPGRVTLPLPPNLQENYRGENSDHNGRNGCHGDCRRCSRPPASAARPRLSSRSSWQGPNRQGTSWSWQDPDRQGTAAAGRQQVLSSTRGQVLTRAVGSRLGRLSNLPYRADRSDCKCNWKKASR